MCFLLYTTYREFPSIKETQGQKKIGCFAHVKIGKEFMIFPSIKKDIKIS